MTKKFLYNKSSNKFYQWIFQEENEAEKSRHTEEISKMEEQSQNEKEELRIKQEEVSKVHIF